MAPIMVVQTKKQLELARPQVALMVVGAGVDCLMHDALQAIDEEAGAAVVVIAALIVETTT